MYNTVKEFEAKLKLFVNQIERSDFNRFENSQKLKNKTKALCSINRFVEILKQLQKDFSSRFLDINLHEKSLYLFQNPFNVIENYVHTSLQFELIEWTWAKEQIKTYI